MIRTASEAIPQTGRVHRLKTWPEPFRAVLDGRKLFEVRRDDRGFEVGDVLRLLEWDPSAWQENLRLDHAGYTGRELSRMITYKVAGGSWGLPHDLCVLGLGELP